jgi:ankyrin repeat protein
VAELPLDKGANIEAMSRYGFTPLHSSCLDGRLEVTRLLLDRGANTRARTINKKTPLALCEGKHHRETTDLLKEKIGITR